MRWSRKNSTKFVLKYLSPRTYQKRRDAIDGLGIVAPWNLVTLLVDGRHSRLQFSQNFAKDHYKAIGLITAELDRIDYYSYKLKGSALNTQMAMCVDGYIEWVSTHSLPAGKWNDISHLKSDLVSFKSILQPGDCVCFDGGYQSIDQEVPAILPHRKHPNYDLTPGQIRENFEIGGVRSPIERKFGELVNKFKFLKRSYRQGDASFNYNFRIACSLLNCFLLEKNRMINPEFMNHPVFKWELSEDFYLCEPIRTVGIVIPENLYRDRTQWEILKLSPPEAARFQIDDPRSEPELLRMTLLIISNEFRINGFADTA